MMEENKRPVLSGMSRRETIGALCWIPLHLLLLPIALVMIGPGLDSADLNFLVYAIGTAALGIFCFRFLAREFGPFCQQIPGILLQILAFYGYMLLGNLLVKSLLGLTLPEMNPNNEAVMDLAEQGGVKIVVMTVILAPILEELMFRAGLFGLLHRVSRVLAYTVVILAFAAYHVWGYAMEEPLYWLYMLEYVPITFLLCRLYEKTRTIWSSILLHMMVNAISMLLLSMAEGLNL